MPSSKLVRSVGILLWKVVFLSRVTVFFIRTYANLTVLNLGYSNPREYAKPCKRLGLRSTQTFSHSVERHKTL
jgi:hypothetical protein